MQMNAGGHPLSIAAIKWTILPQGVREPTGVAIPARGTRAIPGVVLAAACYRSHLLEPPGRICGQIKVGSALVHIPHSHHTPDPAYYTPDPAYTRERGRISLHLADSH